MSVGPTRGPVQRPDLDRDLSEVFQRLEDIERQRGRWVYVGDYPTDPGTTPDSPPYENGTSGNLRFRRNGEWGLDIDGTVVGVADGVVVVTLFPFYRPVRSEFALGTDDTGAVVRWELNEDGELIYLGLADTGGGSECCAELEARTLTAGAGLSGGGTLAADRTFAVNVDDSTIEIDTDALRVKADGITANEIAAGAVGPTELASTAVTPGTYGDATNVGQFIVDADGRITSATDVPITGSGGASPTDTHAWMPLTTVVAGVPELVWDADDGLIPTYVPI